VALAAARRHSMATFQLFASRSDMLAVSQREKRVRLAERGERCY